MLRRVNLTPEQIRAGLPPWLLDEIENFEPLPFDAGRGAVNWLRNHVSDPCEPWVVVLTCAEDWTLLGFFVLAYKQFSFPPDTEELTAMEVAWIARAAHTKKGFGRELLTYAASVALAKGASAFVASPNDPKTAKKVWLERFEFRLVSKPEPGDEVTMQVFLGLQEPPEA
jgi:GNAT superfamily N-acetyltransferase